MDKLAHLIVRFRVAIFVVFVLLGAVGLVAMTHVSINHDMTKYLPADMRVKQGMTLMSEEFGDATIVNLMVKGMPQSERQQFADDIGKFDLIFSVSYDEADPNYNNGDYSLYTATVSYDTYSDEVSRAMDELGGACQVRGYEYWLDCEALDSSTRNLAPVLVFAVFVAMIILFILADSWLEPLLMLFTILVAVGINMGTNVFFGEISETSSACGAILQMALSMDYIIMLLNRYRREKIGGLEGEQAMAAAIKGGVTAIASSSVTTIAGLACLVLMSFTIGRDLGLVLAKGVLLSLICAFAVMPALVLWFDYAMGRTAKPSPHPKMEGMGAYAYKLRYVLLAVFVVVFAVGFSLRGVHQPAFITESKNPDYQAVQEQFGTNTNMVVIYDAADEEKVAPLVESLKQMDGIRSASAYATTLGKPYTAQEMADELGMDASMVRILFYDAATDGQTGAVQGSVLAQYVRTGFAADMGDMLDESTASKLDSLANILDEELGSGTYTAEEAAAALSSHASIRENTVKLIYLAYQANTFSNPQWTMSTDELLTFINKSMLNDPVFSDYLDFKTTESLQDAYQRMVDGRESLLSADHGRIMLKSSYANNSSDMDGLCTQLRSLLDAQLGENSYYLVGQGPMVQEMAASFDGEFNFITWVTIGVILLIVLITFRNLIIPFVLVALIQSAFSWDMVVTALMGNHVYYIALMVVQAILMGATIDYAILYTTNYREARQKLPVRAATAEAYRNSIRTILMSGAILVLVCLVLGIFAEGVVAQICLVISEGATASVLLVLFVLPGVIAALDKLVTKRARRMENNALAE
ncbi:MAG: MMPL family transporter [Coriobacteriia bacterium]|nr:MMPL family transporter [Coriobacteriia bacterium]